MYFNNRYISTYRVIFTFVDTALLLGAVALGYYLRFLGQQYSIALKYLLVRGLFFALVFQLSLYYFELYDLKIIRDGPKFSLRLVQSLVVTVILLMIAYYMFPILNLGRGVLLFTIGCGTAAAFFWRIVYRSIVKGNQLNERVIILGTGEFAREIAKEIRDKGDSGFDVIGHIDENIRRIRHDKPTA